MVQYFSACESSDLCSAVRAAVIHDDYAVGILPGAKDYAADGDILIKSRQDRYNITNSIHPLGDLFWREARAIEYALSRFDAPASMGFMPEKPAEQQGSHSSTAWFSLLGHS